MQPKIVFTLTTKEVNQMIVLKIRAQSSHHLPATDPIIRKRSADFYDIEFLLDENKSLLPKH